MATVTDHLLTTIVTCLGLVIGLLLVISTGVWAIFFAVKRRDDD